MVSDIHLLLYFLAAAVIGLSWAVVFQYRDRAAMMREMIAANNESTRLWNHLATALQKLADDVQEVRNQLFKYILNK